MKALTVTGVTANNKVWDGSTNAVLNLAGATLVGVIGNDDVTLDAPVLPGRLPTAPSARGR